MKTKFEVYLGGVPSGTAQVNKVGLYYHISCCCHLTGQVRYRILVTGCNGEVDLGLCVPQGECFGLESRLPIKRVGEGELRFKAVPRHQPLSSRFIPICAEEPFRHIQMLKRAFLDQRDGKNGVMLPDQNSNSNPTGQ